MGSHHFVSPLVLCALLWLFVILHLTRPKPAVVASAASALLEPLKPKRPRSHEPTPCAGLTHKPSGALCARDPAYPNVPPPGPPDPLPPTTRRPRAVDTSRHFGPQAGCDYRGWLGLGTLRAPGQPRGGPWRPCHCTSCPGDFLETQGPLVPGKQAAVEPIVRVWACLAEGLGSRAAARGFEVAPHPVWQWVGEAAEQLHAFSAYFLWALPLEQLQRDEGYAVWRDCKAGASSDDEAIQRLERSPTWGWTAMDPTRKLRVGIAVGSRTRTMAQRVGPQVTQV